MKSAAAVVATAVSVYWLQISPVWYQLKGDSSTTHDGSVTLTGGHDVDQKWIARLREPASQVHAL